MATEDRDELLAHASCLAMTEAMEDSTMKDGERLYFAYGSNLDATQLLTRCGEVWSIGPARLDGYRLAFGGKSATWEGMGVATVLPAPGCSVSGMLFGLTSESLTRLDAFEGYPRAYRRQRVRVAQWTGPQREAWIYLKRPGKFTPNPPGERYLAVVRGAYERLHFDPGPLEEAVRLAGTIATARVFVYGTLLSGEPNHRLLATAKPLGPARTALGYRLHDLGSFPAMVEGGEGAVDGELYEVDDGTLAALDRLEGHPDFYRRVPIRLATGEEVESYVMRPGQVEERAVVEAGDWRGRSC